MARKKKGIPLNGWVNLDKPAGISSTQALGKVKYFMKPQKAGHAGTLDPLATGVLPIALGHATKLVPYAQDALKTYHFTIKWGERRDTDDAEGEVIATSAHRPKMDEIITTLPLFEGDIEQIPPKYSAIKINGERAYDLARDGEDIEMKSRPVYIESLTLLEADDTYLTLECICGKGTYIRSLARDIAHKLGTEGHITALTRTTVGPFSVENAISLDFLEQLGDKDDPEDVLLPLETVLDDIPALSLNQEEAARLAQGNALSFVARPDFQRLIDADIDTEEGDTAAAFHRGKLLGMVRVTGPRIQPERIFK